MSMNICYVIAKIVLCRVIGNDKALQQSVLLNDTKNYSKLMRI